MRKRMFSSMILALVLSIGVAMTPVPAMATPSGIVQFDAVGPLGELGSIAYDGINASGSGLFLPDLSLYSGGNLVFWDGGYDPQAAPFQYAFDTMAGTLSVDYMGGGLLEFQLNPGTILFGTGNFIITPGVDEVLITGTGFDTKDPLFLAALFGVDASQFDPAALYEFGFSLTAIQYVDPDDPSVPPITTWNVSEASITNTVPEPATLLLLGLGIAGCGFFGRRKTKT